MASRYGKFAKAVELGMEGIDMDAATRSVADRLQGFVRQIDELLELVRKRPLKGQQKADAQARMEKLKGDLKAAYKAGSTRKGEAAMAAIEKSTYQPAVHEASSDLMVKSNSNPDAKWEDQLLCCRSTINHFLRPLTKTD